MNECLTTPQHEKQIGYWVSEQGKPVFEIVYMSVITINKISIQIHMDLK